MPVHGPDSFASIEFENLSRENIQLRDLIRSYYRQTIRFVNAIGRLFAEELLQNGVSKMSSDQLAAQPMVTVRERCSKMPNRYRDLISL